jgi:hypothetical protein
MTLVEGEVAGDSGGVPRDMCGWRGCGRFKFQTPLKKKLLKEGKPNGGIEEFIRAGWHREVEGRASLLHGWERKGFYKRVFYFYFYFFKRGKMVRESLNSDTIGIAFCFNKVLKLL